jgi:hypothetical protein
MNPLDAAQKPSTDAARSRAQVHRIARPVDATGVRPVQSRAVAFANPHLMRLLCMSHERQSGAGGPHDLLDTARRPERDGIPYDG